MQAGNSFQCIPNICGKLYCVPGGILVDSMLLLLLHIYILFHNKQTNLELVTGYLCISVWFFVAMMMRWRRSKLRYRILHQFWPWIWQEKVSDINCRSSFVVYHIEQYCTHCWRVMQNCSCVVYSCFYSSCVLEIDLNYILNYLSTLEECFLFISHKFWKYYC